MATVNLLPDGDSLNSWTLSTGSDAYTLVQDDHTGTISTDSNKLTATSAGTVGTFAFDDFTEAHDSIDSVQLVTRAGNNGRGKNFDLETKLVYTPHILYTETSGTQLASSTYRTQTYTSRTTYDGSNPFNNTVVDGLTAVIKLDATNGGTTSFTQVYIIVTYTPPSATDNSIFFGTNF